MTCNDKNMHCLMQLHYIQTKEYVYMWVVRTRYYVDKIFPKKKNVRVLNIPP